MDTCTTAPERRVACVNLIAYQAVLDERTLASRKNAAKIPKPKEKIVLGWHVPKCNKRGKRSQQESRIDAQLKR